MRALLVGALLLVGCGGGGVGPNLDGAWKVEAQFSMDGTLGGEVMYLLCSDVVTKAGEPGHYEVESSCSMGPKAFTIGKIITGGTLVSKKKEICQTVREYDFEPVPVPAKFKRKPEAAQEFKELQSAMDAALDDIDWNEDPCERIVEAKDGRIKTMSDGLYVHWTRK